MPTRRMYLIGFVACTLLLALTSSAVQAQPLLQIPRSSISSSSSPGRSVRNAGPIGTSFPISPVSNTVNHWQEWHSAVAYNSQHQEYLTVWDQGDGAGNNYVYGQFVNRRGGLIGYRFLIPGVSGTNAAPDVAYNPALDEYLVVFEYYQAPSHGIYGQRLRWDGAPVGTQITFASSTTYTYADAAVAFETDTSQYLVAWQKRDGSAFGGIEVRGLSGDGATLGSVIEVTGLLANVWPERPDVACTRTLDECLVVWDRWYSVTLTDHEVHGRRVHMLGGAHLDGSIFSIHFTTSDEIYPAVAAIARPTGIGQYLVVCAYNFRGTWYTVGQLLTDAGALEPEGWLLIGLSNAVAPGVAGNENSQEYLVAWPTSAGTQMQARTVSTLAVTGTIAEAQPPGSAPTYPAVASGLLGDFLVTYQDYYPGYPVDVFGWLWGTRLYLPLLKRS